MFSSGIIHEASSKGDVEKVKKLLSKDAKIVNVIDKQGNTALFHASQSNALAVVEHLLQGGADPNIRNMEGRGPIHIAASIGYPRVVKVLLEANADFTIKDKYSMSAEDACATAGIRLMMEEASRHKREALWAAAPSAPPPQSEPDAGCLHDGNGVQDYCHGRGGGGGSGGYAPTAPPPSYIAPPSYSPIDMGLSRVGFATPYLASPQSGVKASIGTVCVNCKTGTSERLLTPCNDVVCTACAKECRGTKRCPVCGNRVYDDVKFMDLDG